MDRPTFLNLLAEIVEMPENSLTGAERLEDLKVWDSLAMMSVVALASDHCGVALSPRKMAECQTVEDLLGLLPPFQS
jgi:acyl carrier protein